MPNPSMRCECGIPNPIPSARVHPATGRPVNSFNVVCPCGKIVARVQDFGNCNGIRKVRGFAGILAEQKAAIRLERKTIADILKPLEAPIRKELDRLQWNSPKRQELRDKLEMIRKSVRGMVS